MNKALLDILIVDDESLIAFTLQRMLQNMGFLKINMVHTEEEAIHHLLTKKVDIALLDINLGEGSEGLSLAKICQQQEIAFLYISSYTDKATLDKAIKTSPGAYVTKPFMAANLYAALEITLSKFIEVEEKKYFTFKDKGSLIKVAYDEIVYLKADDIYAEIFTENKAYVYRSSIRKLLEVFDTDKIIKVHRSYAVNLRYITKINANSVALNDIEIPLSRTFKADLIERFEESSNTK